MMSASIHGAGSAPAQVSGKAVTTRVTHLDQLLGGHPAALRSIYEAGTAPAPEGLVGSWRGIFLALEAGRDVASLMRPIFQLLRGGGALWQGKTFFADATGVNRVLGQKLLRLGVETGFSELDGASTIVFRYDLPRHENPWPLRNMRDELRMIGDGIALGPVLFSATAGGRRDVVSWFGLEREG